jgi:hypothetical protein
MGMCVGSERKGGLRARGVNALIPLWFINLNPFIEERKLNLR